MGDTDPADTRGAVATAGAGAGAAGAGGVVEDVAVCVAELIATAAELERWCESEPVAELERAQLGVAV